MILLRVMRVMINFTPKIKLMIEEIKQEDFLFDKIKSQLKKIKGKLFTIFLQMLIHIIQIRSHGEGRLCLLGKPTS